MNIMAHARCREHLEKCWMLQLCSLATFSTLADGLPSSTKIAGMLECAGTEAYRLPWYTDSLSRAVLDDVKRGELKNAHERFKK